MNPKRFTAFLAISVCCLTFSTLAWAQQEERKPAKQEAPAPRAKDGRKLFAALDLIKVCSVPAAGISPYGASLSYTVGGTKKENEKERKKETQRWVRRISDG